MPALSTDRESAMSPNELHDFVWLAVIIIAGLALLVLIEAPEE